ncbi:MAG: hypothetical protein ACFFF4_09960 [Candidatus Thorarchaeota archaeon]
MSRCSYCGSSEGKKGPYLTMKGVEATMKFNFHGLCLECSKKFFFCISVLTSNLDKTHDVLSEAFPKEDESNV